MRDAYYSERLGSWVRMERQEDGEWCHTSGFGSRQAALLVDTSMFVDRSKNTKPLFGPSGLPSFLEFSEEVDGSSSSSSQSSSKKPRRKAR
jgi:hypothetical protein